MNNADLPHLTHLTSAGSAESAESAKSAHGVSDVPSRMSVATRRDADLPTIPGVDLSKEEMRTFINEGDEIEGNLVIKAGLRVKGVVRGSVRCEGGTVFVEKGGHVTGSIESKGSIILDGLVGVDNDTSPRVKVITPGGVFLMNDSVVNADVEYGRLATYGDMALNGTARKVSANR